MSLVADPTLQEVTELINLLNAEPADIRKAGGPAAYLEKSHVRSIQAIDAIYTGGGKPNHSTDTLSEEEIDSALLDPAVRALIERTCNEITEGDLMEVPLTDILSSSDATAKLIWESVIKLHSTSSQSVGELGFQVIHNLKGMSANRQNVWDQTTLEIRKAISKLPDEIRSTAFGFLAEMPGGGAPVSDADEPANGDELTTDFQDLEGNVDLESLFKRKRPGMLPSWQKELQADTIMRYSGRTMAMLMTWESDPADYGRLARALALLIPKALSMKDEEGALTFAESLLKEANITDAPQWRANEALSSLRSLDMHSLRDLVEYALDSEGRPHVVASLIETVPSLSLILTDFLRSSEHRTVNDAIKQSLVKSGPEATPALRELLRDESPAARQAALEILVQTGTEPAVNEISSAMTTADDAFLITALAMLPSTRTFYAARICEQYTRHRTLGVRIAALRALGELGDQLALGILIQAASRKTRDLEEQMTAITALGKVGGSDAVFCLQRIADRRPFFWRSGYQPIRIAAQQALNRLQGEISGD